MQVTQVDKEGYNLLHEGAQAFSDIQQNGIKIDVSHCKNEYSRLGRELKELKNKLMSDEVIKTWKKTFSKNFNMDSNDQLAVVLYDKLGYQPQKFTEAGGRATDQEALKALEIPVTDDLLRYRKLEKIRNTFLKGLITETCDGWLHPFLNLNTARTFRSSSDKVNIQNQPTRDKEAEAIIRKAFRTRGDDFCMVAGDYGGVEVKGSQWYHCDPVMHKYLNNPDTADMHADFCKSLFRLEGLDESIDGEKTLRKGTKNGFTFPQFYGDYYGNNAVALWVWAGLRGNKLSPKRNKSDEVIIRGDVAIGDHLRNKGIKNFQQFMDHVESVEDEMWREKFKVYKQWRDDQWNWYNKHGYVTILSGFTCKGVMTRNAVINYPIQGVCFHALLWSVIQLNKKMKEKGMKSRIIFQVHDEVVADVHKDEYDDFMEMKKQIMVHDIKDHWSFINTPLELEAEASPFGGTWYDLDFAFQYVA